MRIREYGTAGPTVVVLHGGPGAPGYVAPVARALADAFRVVEPFQRGSSGTPLTVARHVADLHALATRRGGDSPPAVIGHSWGAMLALAHAATHPGDVRALVLVGCGTFTADARERLHATLDERMTGEQRHRLAGLSAETTDPDECLRARAELLLPLYSCETLSDEMELTACDSRAHEETWNDMLRLQDEGVYPAAFAAIRAPVLMLHGAVDPHPGALIRSSLEPYLPRLEYLEWERCGHYPWLERAVRDEFFAVLRRWLGRHPAVTP